MVNANVAGATASPASVASPGLTVNVHATPAGRSRAKSNTQLRPSAQRPTPFSGHATSNGATTRGSPNGTICAEKRAAT